MSEKAEEKRNAITMPPMGKRLDAEDSQLTVSRSLQNLSLGNVAATNPQVQLPKKYRKPRPGEKSTYQGAGIVPVTRMANNEVQILLWQPQRGSKEGVRWYDFGGKKEHRAEFTSTCACRKFAKQTYGAFGCQINMAGAGASEQLAELYQGLCNLPLMLKTSQEWAKMQLLDDDARIFYNDIHEYHAYLLYVPHVPADLLGRISHMVDGGKRKFRWFNKEDLRQEVLCPRLHTDSFVRQVEEMMVDPWIRSGQKYGAGAVIPATGCFSAKVA